MPQYIPTHKREVIVNRLMQAGIQTMCPMCGGELKTLMDGYVVTILQPNIRKLQLGGKTLPAVAMVCGKCGYLRQHALGPLGLLEIVQEEEEDNVKTE